jgi:hypothetical protein
MNAGKQYSTRSLRSSDEGEIEAVLQAQDLTEESEAA